MRPHFDFICSYAPRGRSLTRYPTAATSSNVVLSRDCLARDWSRFAPPLPSPSYISTAITRCDDISTTSGAASPSFAAPHFHGHLPGSHSSSPTLLVRNSLRYPGLSQRLDPPSPAPPCPTLSPCTTVSFVAERTFGTVAASLIHVHGHRHSRLQPASSHVHPVTYAHAPPFLEARDDQLRPTSCVASPLSPGPIPLPPLTPVLCCASVARALHATSTRATTPFVGRFRWLHHGATVCEAFFTYDGVCSSSLVVVV